MEAIYLFLLVEVKTVNKWWLAHYKEARLTQVAKWLSILNRPQIN